MDFVRDLVDEVSFPLTHDLGFILIVRLLRSPTTSHSSFRSNNGADRHSNHVSSMPASHLMRGALITFEGVMSDIRVTNMVYS